MPSSGKFSDRLNWDHPDAIRTLERVAIRGTGKVGNPERCPNCNAIVRVLGVRQEH